jgi:hypothetical protein
MKAAPLALLLLLAPLLSGTALAAGGAGSGADAQPASRLEVTMTLYAGGITMGKMDLDASLRGNDYRAVSNLKTEGIVNAFWKSEIQATASGKIGAHTLAPGLYDSFYTGAAGKKQEVSLTYESGAAPRLFADPPYSTTGYEVKAADTKDTLDPLSALTFIASGVGADGGNPCALTVPVFDGRRRYNIEMTRVRDLDIKLDNGAYAGKAVQCDLRYRQVAGFRPRVLKSDENFPVLHAWVARFPSAIAERAYTVPVRVWAETRYGVMAVVADSMRVDGQAPKGAR